MRRILCRKRGNLTQANIDSARRYYITVHGQSDDQGKLNLDRCPLDIPFCRLPLRLCAPKITIGHARAEEPLSS